MKRQEKADKIGKLDKKADELDKRKVSEQDLQRWQAEYRERREGRSETQNHMCEARRPAKGRKQNVKKEELILFSWFLQQLLR